MGHNLGQLDLLLNLGISSVFPEWLHLQTSKLVCTMLKQRVTQKCKDRSQGVKTRSHGYVLSLSITEFS